ncbi:hypothetical protein M514_19638 [Trichuris suis]|uniref:Uncharacterized protein n=1 Tax=Trichuris suis TaxID=68888 RepID=A0A085NFB0_9BILA|nr:hypothetical protein M514_19638 [Trichuris suis]
MACELLLSTNSNQPGLKVGENDPSDIEEAPLLNGPVRGSRQVTNLPTVHGLFATRITNLYADDGTRAAVKALYHTNKGVLFHYQYYLQEQDCKKCILRSLTNEGSTDNSNTFRLSNDTLEVSSAERPKDKVNACNTEYHNFV